MVDAIILGEMRLAVVLLMALVWGRLMAGMLSGSFIWEKVSFSSVSWL